MPRPWSIRVLVLLGTLGGGLAREAQAIPACTAAQISAQDPGCPSGSGQCQITKKFEIGNGCLLDFSGRAIVVSASGELNIGSGTVTISGGSFTVAAGGLVEGRGRASIPPANRGGMLTIETTGAVAVQRAASRGTIDLSGYTIGGTLLVRAGGGVTLDGKVQVDGFGPDGTGGDISIRSGGDILGLTGSLIAATGTELGSGGFMDFQATGRIEFVEELHLQGSDGGLLDIIAGADAVVRNVDADAVGDAGSGGCIGIVGGTGTQLLGLIRLNGNVSAVASGGGDGGVFCAEANRGDLSVTDRLLAEGNSPDGGGGQISLIARGSVHVGAGTTVSAQGIGPSGCGGEVSLEGELDVTSAGALDVSGGLGGNSLDVLAGRNVTLSGRMDLEGENAGAFGGTASLEAGVASAAGLPPHTGSISISDVLIASGGGCSAEFGCGIGGSVDVLGCDVTVASTARITALGKTGGQITLVAREQLRVQAPLDTTAREAGTNGTIVLRHRKTPVITVQPTPAPTLQGRPTCTAFNLPAACLSPCPTCGNGSVEFPETCDTAGPPQACDGCSIYCQTENCNDASPCTIDSCEPALGCHHTPTPDATTCDDGTVCNGRERCMAGTCVPGPPPGCNDGNGCTLDPCDPATGCLTHAPAPTGTACTDNNACTTGDACDGAGGCQPGGPRVCDDGRECTTDACAPTAGCVFTNRSGPCTDDGDSCTLDFCNGNRCTHPQLPECSATTTTIASGTTTTSILATTTTTVSAPTTTSSTATSSSTTTSSTTTVSSTTVSTTSSSSTTAITPPPTTTTTTPPVVCVPLDCNDDDPCTADTCAAGGCRHTSLTGFDAARCIFQGAGVQQPVCAGQPVPTSVGQRFAQAGGLIEQGASETRAKKAKRLVGKARKILRRIAKTIARAEKKQSLSPDCSAALGRIVVEAASRAEQVRNSL